MTHRRRGVTLLLVLWIIVVLGGIAATVTAQARRAGDAASGTRARLAARYAAESAIAATTNAIERALVAAGEDTLARQRVLNALEERGGTTIELGAERAQVAVVDVSARLDVNAASADALQALFAAAGQPGVARRTAEAIKAYIGGNAGAPARLLQSLDELRDVPGVDSLVISEAVPFLTVDGDGRVNRATASRLVRSAAAGDLQNEPSRLLLIARGWQDGHPLTHELQVVVAVQGTQLATVRWRERDR